MKSVIIKNPDNFPKLMEYTGYDYKIIVLMEDGDCGTIVYSENIEKAPIGLYGFWNKEFIKNIDNNIIIELSNQELINGKCH